VSAFSGKQYRGAMRAHRETKRLEAVARAAVVAPDRTKAARLGAVKLGGAR
jgi:hypothetical protein